MNDEQTTSTELIQRILDDARTEAESIRSEARRSVEERRAALESRLARIERAADERIAAERSRLERRADSAIALAESRARLALETRIYRAVEERVREALLGLRGSDEYPGIVRDWIVEAAIGLRVDQALVDVPAADRACAEEVLAEAETRVHELTGRSVTLEIGPQTDAGGQGVILRDPSGRRAFSNLVVDRIRRFRAGTQRVVYDEVVRELPGEDNDG